jgi:hypothetical protein
LAHPLLTRCRRKSESPAQRVKKPATTTMIIDTAKGFSFSADRAASQPLQREENNHYKGKVPMGSSSPRGLCIRTTTWGSPCSTGKLWLRTLGL